MRTEPERSAPVRPSCRSTAARRLALRPIVQESARREGVQQLSVAAALDLGEAARHSPPTGGEYYRPHSLVERRSPSDYKHRRALLGRAMRFGHAHDHDGDAPRMAGDGRSSRSSASAVSRHRMVELAPGPEPAGQRKRGVLSRWWDSFTGFLRHPFRDCYNMCDLERPFGASPGSPGVTVLPQHFPRMDRDLKYDFTAGPISSSAASKSSSPARSTRSKTSSDSFLSYDDPYDQPTQFLFYCGSDPLTPTSAQLAARNGLKTDTISGYTPTAGAEPQVHTPLASPRISHQIPVFFSPRNAPTSPAAAPLYSPHLFRITEREYDPYFMRYSR